MNPVAVFITKETCQLDFTCMEHVYNTLLTAFDLAAGGSGAVTDTAKDLFYAGDGSALTSVRTQAVMLSSRIRTAPTKFEVLVIYSAYNVEGITIGYNRTKEAIYKVTMKALVEGSRSAGDRLFQFYRER